jgi:FKBP-type peptidyl-prolyl cis-trans isomerase (trigger factor)
MDVSRIDVTRFREHLGETATNRVRGRIIIERIIAQEKITTDAHDIEQKINEIIERSNLEAEKVRSYFTQSEQREELSRQVVYEKAWQLLEERTKFEYTKPKEEKKRADKKRP